jgi:hypothetical protein
MAVRVAWARVDDAAEDALVLRVWVAPAEGGEVVTHPLGGLAVLEKLGRGASFRWVRADGVAGVGPFHGRGRGGVRRAEARDRGRISVVRMGVVKRRWVAEERLLNRPESHGTSKRVVLDVLHPLALRLVVMVVIVVGIGSAPLHQVAGGAV